MTTPQVVEASVTINRTTFTRTTIFLLLINDMTAGLKPFFASVVTVADLITNFSAA